MEDSDGLDPSHRKRKKHATLEERQVAINLHKQGFTPDVIAEVHLAGKFSAKSVSRWIDGWELTGVVKPPPGRPWVRRQHYSREALWAMERILRQDNGLKAREVWRKVWEETGEAASLRCCQEMIKWLEWNWKATSTESKRRDRETMRRHAQCCELFHPRQFLYADEMHKRGRDMRRKRGYGKGGQPSIVPLSPHLGRAWTVLACFDYTGFVDWYIQELASKPTESLPKAVDRELWMTMFRECVLPHLRPCDERQLPRSVLVVDNCSLHWASPDQINELEKLVLSVGAELLYIPQYCPRANAIEGGFSQVNKALEDDIVLADRDPARALDQAFLSVGPRYGAAFARRSVKDVRAWL